MDKIIDILPYLDHPLVLAGFVIFLLFGLYKYLIKKNILHQVDSETNSRLVVVLVKNGFLIAILIIILGFSLEFYKESARKENKQYYGYTNSEIVAMAKDYQLTTVAVEHLLEKLRERRVPAEKLILKFDEIANHYNDLQEKVISLKAENLSLNDNNEKISKSLDNALRLLSVGNVDQAEDVYESTLSELTEQRLASYQDDNNSKELPQVRDDIKDSYARTAIKSDRNQNHINIDKEVLKTSLRDDLFKEMLLRQREREELEERLSDVARKDVVPNLKSDFICDHSIALAYRVHDDMDDFLTQVENNEKSFALDAIEGWDCAVITDSSFRRDQKYNEGIRCFYNTGLGASNATQRIALNKLHGESYNRIYTCSNRNYLRISKVAPFGERRFRSKYPILKSASFKNPVGKSLKYTYYFRDKYIDIYGNELNERVMIEYGYFIEGDGTVTWEHSAFLLK